MELPQPQGTLGSFPKPPDTPVCNVTALGTPRCIAECQGQEKCCFYGCRWQCLTPVKEKWQPCPTFNTSMCPLAPPETSECHDDNQCPGTQRCCCHGNCTLQCTETVRENKRFCPLQHRRPPSCAAPPPPECHGDRDCRRNEKCCFFGCGFQCVKALEEKPGVCPTTKDLCPSPSDEKLCSRDRQCPGLQKCCPECGHRCVDLKQEQMLFCPYVNVTLIKCNASSAKSQCSND
ncbi:hypothetical protein NDU88_011681 [Pleurodeles waltl]|uniref:WAP domain-containing protein n=1 Tax=Pleurodeles waltl TaxID=8319 RepID=A0AAV7S4Y0_PLEWA|nr:hypothetical protein NDU88_011681 [Pleurodeles waltl]